MSLCLTYRETESASQSADYRSFKEWLTKNVFPELCSERSDKSSKSSKTLRLLAVPPDYSRKTSLSGEILQWLYEWLVQNCKKSSSDFSSDFNSFQLDILPALGTHHPMSEIEIKNMFGDLATRPEVTFLEHHYKDKVKHCGTMSLTSLLEMSEQTLSDKVSIDLSTYLFEDYDSIFSLGQVLPHEILGMSNYTKNLVIGLGGKDIIDKTHFLSALLGMEQIIGKADNVIREFINEVYEECIAPKQRVRFIHTVMTSPVANHGSQNREEQLYGVSYGYGEAVFKWAVEQSERLNIIEVPKALETVWAEFPKAGYHSTWIANKAIYRLRLIVGDGGELVIIAPGMRGFGEVPEQNTLIKRYGFRTQSEILELMRTQEDLKSELAVAGHLIYGSSNGKFKITYAVDPKLISLSEIEAVGYRAISYEEATYRRDEQLGSEDAVTTTKSVYNPALGFWRVSPPE